MLPKGKESAQNILILLIVPICGSSRYDKDQTVIKKESEEDSDSVVIVQQIIEWISRVLAAIIARDSLRYSTQISNDP